jgi:excinuclease ABC subunit B
MKEAAGNLEFEDAARLRDEIRRLQTVEPTDADMGPHNWGGGEARPKAGGGGKWRSRR